FTWQSEGEDGDSYGIYSMRYQKNNSVGAEFRVNTFTTGAQTSPAVAIDSKGDYVMTWQSATQDGSGEGIIAQRFVQPALVNGTLTVHGSSANDGLSLINSAGQLIVIENTDVLTFTYADVTHITINMGAGNDSATIGAAIMAVSMDGGSGND